MKGEKRLRILEGIELGMDTIGDLVFIFSLPYGTSFSKMRYLLANRDRFKKSDNNNEKKRFQDLMYHLRRDGLIDESKRKLILTLKGKKFLNRKKFTTFSYKKESDNIIKIIIFDIPESQRRKRVWLRQAIKTMGFQMIQKSVWLGKVKIPEEFLNDLKNMNLMNYIEIIGITKIGTLKQMKYFNL